MRDLPEFLFEDRAPTPFVIRNHEYIAPALFAASLITAPRPRYSSPAPQRKRKATPAVIARRIAQKRQRIARRIMRQAARRFKAGVRVIAASRKSLTQTRDSEIKPAHTHAR